MSGASGLIRDDSDQLIDIRMGEGWAMWDIFCVSMPGRQENYRLISKYAQTKDDIGLLVV
ncbi:hypothetical protein TA3x_003163 [Tundrisphaera sp. TA3]|uniref:hypothetical protein n=1 Tax=Tundrisphaera sp. TA3 TaxID=3435775 RepID=UPI003EC07DD5